MNLHNAEFVISAVSDKQYPGEVLPEVAMVGRSNVGKSSLINKILNRKNFARVSSKPGKTTTINFYSIDKKLMLVDLPGYGYAKVSKKEKEKWGGMIENYLAQKLTQMDSELLQNPLVSPLFADFTGFPPTYIQVGDEEVLLSDAELLAKKMTKAKVSVKLDVFHGMWHVFQMSPLKKSGEAIDKCAEFIFDL